MTASTTKSSVQASTKPSVQVRSGSSKRLYPTLILPSLLFRRPGQDIQVTVR